MIHKNKQSKKQHFRKLKNSTSNSSRVKVTQKRQKSSPIDESNILRQVLLQRINQNNLKNQKLKNNLAQRIDIRLHFSEIFSIQMCIPSSLTIFQLGQLAACYVKLHLKNLPSKDYVYSGLTIKNTFNFQDSYQSQKLLILSNQNQKAENLKNQTFSYKETKRIHQMSLEIVRFIVFSMTLAAQQSMNQTYSFINQQVQLGQLMVYQEQLLSIYNRQSKLVKDKQFNWEQIKQTYDMWIRYDNNKSTTKKSNRQPECKQKSIYIQELQDSLQSNISRSLQDQTVLGLLSMNEIKNSLLCVRPNNSDINCVTFESEEWRSVQNKVEGQLQSMMKWLQSIVVEEWLLLRDMIIGSLGQIDSIGVNDSYQTDNKCSYKVIVVPVRLKSQSKVYQLVITQSLSQKQQLETVNFHKRIIEFFLKSNFPLSHKLQQAYTLSTQHPIYRIRTHQILVLYSQSYRKIQLTEYLRQLLGELNSMIQEQPESKFSQVSQQLVQIYNKAISILTQSSDMHFIGSSIDLDKQSLFLDLLVVQFQPNCFQLQMNAIRIISSTLKNNISKTKTHSRNNSTDLLTQRLKRQFTQIIRSSLTGKSQPLVNWFHEQITQKTQSKARASSLFQKILHIDTPPTYTFLKHLYKTTKKSLLTSYTAQTKYVSKQLTNHKIQSFRHQFSQRLFECNQTIQQTKSLFSRNISNSTLHILHSYRSPQQTKLLAGEQIDIFEKQTTLKKNKITKTKQNTQKNSLNHLHENICIKQFSSLQDKRKPNYTLSKLKTNPIKTKKQNLRQKSSKKSKCQKLNKQVGRNKKTK